MPPKARLLPQAARRGCDTIRLPIELYRPCSSKQATGPRGKDLCILLIGHLLANKLLQDFHRRFI